MRGGHSVDAHYLFPSCLHRMECTIGQFLRLETGAIKAATTAETSRYWPFSSRECIPSLRWLVDDTLQDKHLTALGQKSHPSPWSTQSYSPDCH